MFEARRRIRDTWKNVLGERFKAAHKTHRELVRKGLVPPERPVAQPAATWPIGHGLLNLLDIGMMCTPRETRGMQELERPPQAAAAAAAAAPGNAPDSWAAAWPTTLAVTEAINDASQPSARTRWPGHLPPSDGEHAGKLSSPSGTGNGPAAWMQWRGGEGLGQWGSHRDTPVLAKAISAR